MKQNYLDVEKGLWSKQKLALKYGIPVGKIKGIEYTELYQRTKPQPARVRRKKYHQIITKPKQNGRHWNFQGDILEFYSRDKDRVQHNYGFKYILIFLDAYSRKIVGAYPMKKKNTEWIFNKTKEVIEKNPVINLSFDRESGIRSKKVQDLLQKHDVKLWHAENFQPGGKMSTSLIERLNRSVRSLLRRAEILHPNSVLISHLPAVVRNYNSTPHMGLKERKGGKWIYRTPNSVFEKQDYKQIRRKVPEIEEGELVRILIKKKMFGKGTQEWSKKLYTVLRRVKNKYVVSHKGVQRKGRLGPQDLQVVYDVTDQIEEARPLPEAEGGEDGVPSD